MSADPSIGCNAKGLMAAAYDRQDGPVILVFYRGTDDARRYSRRVVVTTRDWPALPQTQSADATSKGRPQTAGIPLS